jgi:hypothetical protein
LPRAEACSTAATEVVLVRAGVEGALARLGREFVPIERGAGRGFVPVTVDPCPLDAEEGVVPVCPGGPDLGGRETRAAGWAFIRPGAAALDPADGFGLGLAFVRAGAAARREWEALAAGVVCRSRARASRALRPFWARAPDTEAGRAGRRSEAGGCRGVGNCESGGGPCAGPNAWVSGIPASGISPRPPNTIASNQTRKSMNTMRPARRIQRARVPVGSSRTVDPALPKVVPRACTSRSLLTVRNQPGHNGAR